jgi:hypothetical protein
MKHKIIVFALLLFASVGSTYAQSLTFDDLIAIQKKSLVEVNSFLIGKGWTFENSNTDEKSENNVVGWSLKKNKVTNKAQGWFYLYSHNGFENYIKYQTIKNTFVTLQAKCKSSNFTADDVNVKEDKMEIGYKRGAIKCLFSTAKQEEIADEYDETDIFYTIELFNYHEIENYINVLSKIEEEKLREQLLKEEKLKKEQLVQKEYSDLIEKGNVQFSKKQFPQAKLTYSNAISIFPDQIYPREKIAEIEKIEQFHTERNNTVYKYADVDNVAFAVIVKKIENELMQISSFQNEALVKGYIIIKFDTSGNKNLEIKCTSKQSLNNSITKKINSLDFSKPKKLEFEIATCDTINFSINYTTKLISVKKKENDININESVNDISKSEIRGFLQSKPLGKYKLSIKNIEVNNHEKIIVDQIKFSKSHSAKVILLSITGALAGGGYLAYYYLRGLF